MDEPLINLSGVGEKTAKLMSKLGVDTINDLIEFTPRRYENYTHISDLSSIEPGLVAVEVGVESATSRYVKRGLHITEAVLADNNGVSIKAVWFNQPYRKSQLAVNHRYIASGSYEFNGRSYVLLNPSLKIADPKKNNQSDSDIVPVYKQTKGLSSAQIVKIISKLNFDDLKIEDDIPYKHDLSRKKAYQFLHVPRSIEEVESARDFFALEELFSLILASELSRRQNDSFKAPKIKFDKLQIIKFLDSLSFSLTDDQKKAAWQCIKDQNSTVPMNRLIEGDVGSGKTIVAICVALNALLNDHQVAIMVPTEVLARQHFKSITEMLKKFDVRTALYVSSLSSAKKSSLRDGLKNGDVDLVIGTHALIQDKVSYRSLAQVIIDEQHRFGVEQRNALVHKSKQMPHVLTMTATPIPRTLALTVFGDLNISLIKQMPGGRLPIETKIVPMNSIEQVFSLVDKEISNGRQAFFIYPIIDESESIDVMDVNTAYKKFSNGRFNNYRVGLIHGRLKSDEKDLIMKKFVNGQIDILFSTTVIEVGVDVPNASVMVIEGAERFGLAQIHQLRGRVGRSSHKSYCFLVPTISSNIPKRLRAIEQINDGFKLAEYDLSLRGPGAIYGKNQHGELDVNYTDLNDVEQIVKAKKLVSEFINNQEKLLNYPRLASKVNQYRTITHLN